ncbi:hypothetical protein LTR66_007909 [Elasticomyces elasticus]|nr:hypothetical protein LTR28_003922 [Elasticomyces elasticus]KAK4986317.1 hypothetical protein LTR66_007909 [Elasticomyces elasticus]
MSDALCGPSNALQQFQKQSKVDRTLQQDRLVARHHPAQGFRTPEANAGILDPEFEAFQLGLQPSVTHQPFDNLQHLQQIRHTPRPFGGSSQAPGWAADFESSSHSARGKERQYGTPSFQAHQIQTGFLGQQNQRELPYREVGQASASRWQQDFEAQQWPGKPLDNVHSRFGVSSASHYQSQPYTMYSSLGNSTPFSLASTRAREREAQNHSISEHDDAAFERAFNLAQEEMLGETDSMVRETGATDVVEKTVAMHEELEDMQRLHTIGPHAESLAQQLAMDASEQLEEEASMQGARSRNTDEHSMLHEMTQDTAMMKFLEAEAAITQREASARSDEDDLAATAGQLLEKVADNKTQKFQDSIFFGLMRKLRDREVTVQGDKMVETGVASSVPQTSIVADAPQSLSGMGHAVRQGQNQWYSTIPMTEQDHDYGRNDGQDVVDLLNQPSYDDDIGK